MIYVNNKEKIDNIKLEKDNFYVVADFDKTITDRNSNSTWNALVDSNDIAEEYTKKRMDLYNYYRPIEIDSNISDEEKSQAMSNWWETNIDLFFEYGIKENGIKKGILNGDLKYREGAKEFLHEMKRLEIPVIIISAGIGNIIEEFLKFENDYFDNIHIVSNYINFENGHIKNLKGDTIHALNKNIVKLDNTSKELLKNRKNILLLGDGVADLKMISENDKENAITVGFLEEKIEENLEYFNEAFDIVITNNGTFNDVNKILKIY